MSLWDGHPEADDGPEIRDEPEPRCDRCGDHGCAKCDPDLVRAGAMATGTP